MSYFTVSWRVLFHDLSHKNLEIQLTYIRWLKFFNQSLESQISLCFSPVFPFSNDLSRVDPMGRPIDHMQNKFLNNARLNVSMQTYGAGGTNTNRPESKKCTNFN